MKNIFKKIGGLCLGLAMLSGVAVGMNSSKNEEIFGADSIAGYESVYENACAKNTSNTAYGTTYDVTINSINWKGYGNMGLDAGWGCGGKSSSTISRYYYTKTAITEKIELVRIKYGTSSAKTVSGTFSVFSTAADAASNTNAIATFSDAVEASTNKDFTTDTGWTNKFYRLDVSVNPGSTDKNKYIYLKSFAFYKKQGSTKTLSSLAVSGTPTKTTYQSGEKLNPAGLTVTGTYDDSSTETITEGITWNYDPATLSAGATSCGVTATVGTVTSPNYTVTGLTVIAHQAKIYGKYEGAITAGQYVIVGNSTSYALKAATSNSRFTNFTVTITDNTITDPNDLIVWDISADGDYWTFYNESTSKYAGTTSSSGNGSLGDSVTDYYKWSISFLNGYTVTNKGKSSNNYLRNNNTSGWAAYSASTGNAPTFYKKDYVPKTFDKFDYISSTPTRTTYQVGDTFNPEGLEIHATYTVPSLYPAEDITDEIVWDSLKEGSTATGTWDGHVVTINGLTITAFSASTFTKVNSLDEIANGSEVIFGYRTNDGDGYVLSSFSDKYFTKSDADTCTETTINNTSTSITWTVEVDSYGYYFKNGNNYLNRNNGDNSFGIKSHTTTTESAWVLSFVDSQFKMKSFDNDNYLKYNISSPRFKCYNGSGADINIYIKNEASIVDKLKTFTGLYLRSTELPLTDSETGISGTDCKDLNYYTKAKAALVSGTYSSYNDDFQSSEDTTIIKARLRYEAWARACGDMTPYAGEGIVSANRLSNMFNNNSNVTWIIVVTSLTGLTAIGGYFFYKKRKENI